MTGLAPLRWTLIAGLSAVVLAFACPGPAAAEVTFQPAGGVVFGTVQPSTAVDSDVNVVNAGTTSVTIGEATLTGNSSFSIALDDCAGLTLEPDEFCVVVVRFKPAVGGEQTAQLSVPSDDPGSPHVLSVSGTGVGPTRPLVLTPGVLGVVPGALDFGLVVAKKARPLASLNLTTSGAVGRVSTRFEGPDAGAFGSAAAPLFCHPRAMNPTCPVAVVFAPQREGPHEATLVITGRNSNTVTVALHGTGVPPPVAKMPDRQVKRLLKGALTVPIGKWRDKGRRSILKAKGFRLNGPAISGSGTLKLQMRTVGKRQRFVASGRLAYPSQTKQRTVDAGLTRAGKALLGEQGKRRLQAVLTFIPADGTRLAASRSFTLPG